MKFGNKGWNGLRNGENGCTIAQCDACAWVHRYATRDVAQLALDEHRQRGDHKTNKRRADFINRVARRTIRDGQS